MRVHVRRRLTAPLLLQDWVIRRKLSLCSNHFKKREEREEKITAYFDTHSKKRSFSCTITLFRRLPITKFINSQKIQLLCGKIERSEILNWNSYPFFSKQCTYQLIYEKSLDWISFPSKRPELGTIHRETPLKCSRGWIAQLLLL